MKKQPVNIYLLPTDKASKISLYSTGLLVLHSIPVEKDDIKTPQHIYIAIPRLIDGSPNPLGEIKEGDWCITKWGIDKCDKVGIGGIRYFNTLSMCWNTHEFENNGVEKIVASDDKSITFKENKLWGQKGTGVYTGIASIQESFYPLLVERYNSGKEWKKGFVEVENVCDERCPNSPSNINECCGQPNYQLKLTSKNKSILSFEESLEEAAKNYINQWQEPEYRVFSNLDTIQAFIAGFKEGQKQGYTREEVIDLCFKAYGLEPLTDFNQWIKENLKK